jgi:hypothetical protein
MTLTMIDPTSSWFKIVELPLVKRLWTMNANGKELLKSEEIFDKSSNRLAKLVSQTWLSRYPQCQELIYDNGFEFKLHFEQLCDSYGIVMQLLRAPIKLCTYLLGRYTYGNTQTRNKQTNEQIFTQYSGISSHSMGAR